MPIKTYLDTNVLITAFRGNEGLSNKAMEIISDENRDFVISDYLRLELLPKPRFYNSHKEVDFMEEYFKHAAYEVSPDSNVTSLAISLASKYDIHPVDALHVSCSLSSNTDEFVTMENKSKPMHKVDEIVIKHLDEL